MLSTESGFSENVYLSAARERITLANHLLTVEPPDYVMACYTAGVAVECLFHAYRLRAQADDTAKHNLAIHAVLGNFYADMSRQQREATAALVGQVVSRWQNNHRYRSADALRQFVTSRRLFVIEGNSTTRTDVLRFNAETLVDAATEIITIGVKRWKN